MQLNVGGRRCVVVGAGRVGTRRALGLLDAGASVVVVDPRPWDPPVPDGADLRHDQRSVVPPGGTETTPGGAAPGSARVDPGEVVAGAFLVVTATGAPEVDGAVAAAAGAEGALVVRADDAAASDALWSATARLGPVEVAVGTSGTAPALAAWVADELRSGLGDLLGADAGTLEALADLLHEVRSERRSTVGTDPAAPVGAPNWRAAIDRSMLEMISSGRRAEAKERLQACRSSS